MVNNTIQQKIPLHVEDEAFDFKNIKLKDITNHSVVF